VTDDSDAESSSTIEPTDDDASAFRLVAQFFVIPLAVVVVAVTIFFLFGLFTREKHTPGEYLDEVVRGSLNRRWQAAYEFATLLGAEPELSTDDALFTKTLRVLETTEEAKVRRYLTLALGRFQRPEAAEALIAVLDDPDEETRLYAALALSSVGDRAAVEPLTKLLRSDEPSLRKAAAYSLGHLGDTGAVTALRVVAEDRHFDVALQAALALAQLGDPHGLDVLRRALDRSVLAALADSDPDHEMTAGQQSEAMINALRGITLLLDTDALGTVRSIASSDPDLRVRDTALRAIEALETDRPNGGG